MFDGAEVTTKLILVTSGEGSPDPARIKFVRSDTNRETSCVECVSFTDEAKCDRGITYCWPLGQRCCSEWEPRTAPHAMKSCKGCGREMPQYLTNQDYCGELCRFVRTKLERE